MSFAPSNIADPTPEAVLNELKSANDVMPHEILSLISDAEDFLRRIQVPKVCNLSFELDGIPFYARHSPDGAHSNLLIWGTLGYLPFSVVSPEKRFQLITILEASRFLKHVKFGVDPHLQILVTGSYQIPLPPTPTYIFNPLVSFLQEARGYIRLIGEHL